MAILPVLVNETGCTRCELHKTAQSVCVATEWVDDSLPPTPETTAVVWIGQNPGLQEDEQNRPFVGSAGEMMRGPYLTGIQLRKRATIYLTNIVRCHTPNNTAPGWKKHIMPCYKYTVADLKTIYELHARVAIVCVWAKASDAVLRLIFNQGKTSISQKQAFARQQEWLEAEGVGGFTVCHSFHPSYVKHYNPDAAYGVSGHMQILSDWLAGVSPEKTQPTIIEPVSPENYKWNSPQT